MNIISILILNMLLLFPVGQGAERGSTIWIGPCGYSYYMTETDDGLPPMVGNARTFEEAERIVNSQKQRDDELRRQLKKARLKR